jgi:hypothetical protein
MKCLTFALVALLCSVVHAQSDETGPMTPAEYKSFLDQVEIELPGWETAIKRIDPSKMNVSYALGKQLDDDKTLGLKEVTWGT